VVYGWLAWLRSVESSVVSSYASIFCNSMYEPFAPSIYTNKIVLESVQQPGVIYLSYAIPSNHTTTHCLGGCKLPPNIVPEAWGRGLIYVKLGCVVAPTVKIRRITVRTATPPADPQLSVKLLFYYYRRVPQARDPTFKMIIICPSSVIAPIFRFANGQASMFTLVTHSSMWTLAQVF
jgi:hypothetical protein